MSPPFIGHSNEKRRGAHAIFFIVSRPAAVSALTAWRESFAG